MQRNAYGNGMAAGVVTRADFTEPRFLMVADMAPRRPDTPDLRVFKRNPAKLGQSITSIEPRTRGYGTYSKCSQYGL